MFPSRELTAGFYRQTNSLTTTEFIKLSNTGFSGEGGGLSEREERGGDHPWRAATVDVTCGPAPTDGEEEGK